MNKDNSLIKIDAVRLLLWTSVILIMIFSLSAIFIIPSINKLKVANEVLGSSNTTLNSSTGKKDRIEQQLNTFLEENKVELDKLHNEFDMNKFKNHCKTFFDEVELEKSVNFDEDYVSYQLSVSTKIASPTVFYNFIDSLENYPNIIRVHFPIIMKSSKDLIKAQFTLQVFKR